MKTLSSSAEAAPVASVVPLTAIQAIVAEMRDCCAPTIGTVSCKAIDRWADQIEAAVAAAGEQQPIRHACAICGGTGLGKGTSVSCTHCAGTGIVYVSPPLYASPVAQGWQPIREALEVASKFVADFVNDYADDFCDEARVEEARKRFAEKTRLGYAAEVNAAIREALALLPEPPA